MEQLREFENKVFRRIQDLTKISEDTKDLLENINVTTEKRELNKKNLRSLNEVAKGKTFVIVNKRTVPFSTHYIEFDKHGTYISKIRDKPQKPIRKVGISPTLPTPENYGLTRLPSGELIKRNNWKQDLPNKRTVVHNY